MISEAYLMDNMEYMKTVPDKWFDLAVVDPPYGIGADSSKISHKRTKPSRPNSYTIYPEFRYHKTDWDNKRPDREYFNELFRISQNQIIWGANYLCEFMPMGNGWIFWNKLNGIGNDFSDGEFAFSSKGVQSRYFECSQFHNLSGGKDRIHPTEKPIKLYSWLYANYLPQGGKVFDSHLGSGSNRIAADKAGNIDFYSTEIDKDYFEAQEKRWKQYKSQGVLEFPV